MDRETLIQRFVSEGMPLIAAKLKVAKMSQEAINQYDQDEVDLDSLKRDTDFLNELMSR